MSGSPYDRYQAMVDRRGPDECWPWRGKPHSDGYGRVRWAGRPTYAHRVSFEIANGPIPDGLRVLHHCDNPPCVNPTHLFLGTDADNQRDKWNKGRAHLTAKLTATDLARVAHLRAIGWRTDAIAVRYGVSRRTVQRVLAGTYAPYTVAHVWQAAA